MIRGLVLSVIWLLAGAGVAGGLFWTFLNTPESTVFTLAASGILALLIYVATGAALGAVLGGWSAGWTGTSRRYIGASVRAMVLPLMAVLAGWWLVGRALGWLAGHEGEIGAWFITTLDWSDVRPLLNGVRVLGEWIRRVLVPFAAIAWLGQLVVFGWRPLLDGATWRRGLSPVRLALVTGVAMATIWAPLTYGLYWMPRGLPPTWVEPAVAVAKFALMALLGAIGLSLIARLAVDVAPGTSAPRSTSSPS